MNLGKINDLGLYYYKQSNLLKSISIYENYISLYPYYIPFYANCSINYFNLKKYDKAYEYIKKALELSNYSFEICKILSHFYLEKNDFINNDKLWLKCQENGHINNYMQRSSHIFKGLKAKPWWNKNEFELETKLLIDNYNVIKEELLNLIKKKDTFDKDSEKLTDEDKGWTKFVFYQKGIKNNKNCEKCPNTTKIIEQITNATTNIYGQIEFSKLEPNTHIKEHTGYTNTRVRIHLGMIIPEGAIISAGKIKKQWKEGSCIYLDDSFIHEVWHKGNKDRYILMVDVWHPELDNIEKRYNSLENNNDKIKYLTILRNNNLLISKKNINIIKIISTENNKPKTGDKVKYNYKCWLLNNGNDLDSSSKKGKPYEYIIDSFSVIKGINQLLKSINYGEKVIATIPSHLAYGNKGIKNVVPPNSDLGFEIELLNKD